MGLIVERIRSTATFTLAVLFLINVFLKSELLDELNLAVLLIVIVLSLAAVEGTSRVVGYFLFATGLSLLIIYRAPFEVWVASAMKNLYLVVMFTVVPLLGSPIRQGDYMEPVRMVFKRHVKTDSSFYLFLSLFSSFLALMVNVAAIPLLYQISLASEKCKNHKLLSTALSRGLASTVIWSPSAASVGLVLGLTGVDWVTFFPYALIVAIASGLTGWLISRTSRQGDENLANTQNGQNENLIPTLSDRDSLNWPKVIELGFFGAVLIIVIVLVSVLTGINTITVVALTSLGFPLIWLGIIKKLPGFWAEFKGDYFREGLPKLKNEAVLFIGAGILATGVSYSHLGDLVPQFLSLVVGNNFTLFSMVIILITVLLAAAGIHPLISVTVIGTAVNPEMYGISATGMAVLLTTAWSLGVAMSPSAANVIAMAGLINRSSLDVGPRWNWPYVAVFSVVAVVIISFLQILGFLY